MRALTVNERIVSDDTDAYVIAEIGHNHEGDLGKAEELVRQAAAAGASAVKLQKRNNRSLYTKEMYDSPYTGRNSYGPTYGAHREFLEFGTHEYTHLQQLSAELGVDFIATAFDFASVDFLAELGVPADQDSLRRHQEHTAPRLRGEGRQAPDREHRRRRHGVGAARLRHRPADQPGPRAAAVHGDLPDRAGGVEPGGAGHLPGRVPGHGHRLLRARHRPVGRLDRVRPRRPGGGEARHPRPYPARQRPQVLAGAGGHRRTGRRTAPGTALAGQRREAGPAAWNGPR